MAMSCIRSTQNKSSYGFKIVPESLEEITSEWCEKVLQKGASISNETKVTSIEITRLSNEEIGEDGGGLSGSLLVKLTPTYGYTDGSRILHTLLVKRYNDLFDRQSSERGKVEVTYLYVGDVFCTLHSPITVQSRLFI